MKCLRCNVFINSNVDVCPLCKNNIDNEEHGYDVYPIVENNTKKHSFIIKLLFLLSFIAVCISLFINFSISKKISWSLFVILAIICFWVTLVAGLRQKKYLLKMMFSEIFLIVILSIIWDYFTGFYMWSLNFVMPFLCAIYTCTMLIMRLFIKNNIKDNMINITINAAIGLVPGILLLFNVLTVVWPAYISVIVSIVIICFILVFNRRQLTDELTRRFHI